MMKNKPRIVSRLDNLLYTMDSDLHYQMIYVINVKKYKMMTENLGNKILVSIINMSTQGGLLQNIKHK